MDTLQNDIDSLENEKLAIQTKLNNITKKQMYESLTKGSSAIGGAVGMSTIGSAVGMSATSMFLSGGATMFLLGNLFVIVYCH